MNHINKLFMAIALVLISTISFAGSTLQFNPHDVSIPTTSGPVAKLVDLRNYVSDPQNSPSQMFYSIENQTDPYIIDCYLESDYFISCKAPRENSGVNTIEVKVTNPQGLSNTQSFNVVVSEEARPEIEFISSAKKITIEPADAISIMIKGQNNTNETECFEASAILDSRQRDELEVDIAQNEFCLSKNQSTQFSITINSKEDARVGTYNIGVEFTSSKRVVKIPFTVEVVDSAIPIDVIRVSEFYVCKEPYEQQVRVKLTNNSSKTQTITLSANNEVLLPEFEFAKTTLRANESDEMDLTIHTNQNTTLQDYRIGVFITSEDHLVQRDIEIRLIECQEDAFDISISPQKYTIKTGEKKNFTITLTSKSDKDQYVRLSSDGTIQNRLDSYNVFLPKNGIKRVKLEVVARQTDQPKEHNIRVNAWNDLETERKDVKVQIRPEHLIEMIVQNNNFEARVCSANEGQVFEVTIVNKGDYEEKVKLSLEDIPSKVQVELSETEVKIKKGSEKKIYVFVNPSIEAQIGNYTVTLNAKITGDTVSEKLKFRVVGSEPDAIQGVIQILSYPKQINLMPGEEKIISVTIKNPLNENLQNVKVRIYGAQNAATIPTGNLGELQAGQTKTFERTVIGSEHASPKTYNATLEVRADGYVTTKQVVIRVGPQAQNDQEEGFLAGLAVFLTSGGLAIGIILIVIIAAILLVSLLNSNKSNSDIEYYNGDA
ncbi:MAG TPA: hypothetical protein VJG83_04340 [archaeon]|nr:hypothetical protein [archaeon]